MFLSLWVILETTELLGWLHRGSTASYQPKHKQDGVFLRDFLYRTSTNNRVDRSFSVLLLTSRLPVCFPDKRLLMNEWIWMCRHGTESRRQQQSVCLKLEFDARSTWPSPHPSEMASYLAKILPLFLQLKTDIGGGGEELVVSKKCPSWGMKTTNFHYKVPFHQNEAIHHCSRGTLTTNPALSTLIWDTLCLKLQCLFGKNSCYRVRKSLNVQKKNRKMEQTYRNTPECQTTKSNRASLCDQRCLIPLWGRMLVTDKQLVSWCEHICTNGSASSFLKPARHWPSVYECKLQVDSDQALNSGIARTIMFCF